MDFEVPYTEEQQRFRHEVRDWIKRNVPEDLKDPVDDRAHAIERDKRWQEVHKKLGAKGWLYPTYPRAYGGGGLTGDHETILGEEFQRAGVPNAFTSPNTIPGIMVWGTNVLSAQCWEGAGRYGDERFPGPPGSSGSLWWSAVQ